MALAARQAAPSRQAPPFALATKPVIEFIGSVSYVSGKTVSPLVLPRNKLLSALYLHVNGTMAVTQPANAGAPSVTAQGWQNLIANATLKMAGSDDPINASGYELTEILRREYPNLQDTSSTPLPGANGASQTTTNEAWDGVIEVPVTVSREDTTGLIMMQGRAVDVSLILTFNAESAVLNLPNSSTAAFTGTVTVYGLFFEIPRDPQSWPNLSVMHQVRSFPTNWTAGGKTTILLPEGEIYRRLFVYFLNGGALDTADAAGFTSALFHYSGSYDQVSIDQSTARYLDAQKTMAIPTKGKLVLDFTRAKPRDYLDTYGLTDLRLDVSFTSAPAANSTIWTVIEQLVPLNR